MGEYRASIEWRRNGADFLNRKYSRVHKWRFDGGIELEASSSPNVVPLPWSSESAIDPEEAFVASLSSCHMLSFLFIAAKRGFVIDSYDDQATGILAKNADGKLAMMEVMLRPEVHFAPERAITASDLDELHHEAHEECFIANSVKTNVSCQPVASVPK